MNRALQHKIISVCDTKIEKKGDNVGLSFYAFFANKNDNPELLMEVAEWWIKTHQLDHFEKALKIKGMIELEMKKA
jgi:mannitol-1-phosphate/altronate dehydrogenase